MKDYLLMFSIKSSPQWTSGGKRKKKVMTGVTKGEMKTNKIAQSAGGLTCWSSPRPAGTLCNWSKRIGAQSRIDQWQTGMHPRHGTNHCRGQRKACHEDLCWEHVWRWWWVGGEEVSCRSAEQSLCLTLSLIQLIMTQTVIRIKRELSAHQHVF